MLLLGIDVGTSSVKVSVVNAAKMQTVAETFFPETENEILPHSWVGQNSHQSGGGSKSNTF